MTKKTMALMATASMSASQIESLSGWQIKSMSASQIESLSGWQIKSLSASQIKSLSGGLPIPVVDDLYTVILMDLNSASRQLDQSTFGPVFDPGDNLCDSPMCVAGHTVHRAGAAGYALANRLGFSVAASLIHKASRPDVSCPRYDAYPDEWAMAYIEARAAEEAAAKAKKSRLHSSARAAAQP